MEDDPVGLVLVNEQSFIPKAPPAANDDDDDDDACGSDGAGSAERKFQSSDGAET